MTPSLRWHIRGRAGSGLVAEGAAHGGFGQQLRGVEQVGGGVGFWPQQEGQLRAAEDDQVGPGGAQGGDGTGDGLIGGCPGAALAGVAQQEDATALGRARPQRDAETVRGLSELAGATGLDVLVLPPLRDIIGGQPTSYDLRDVNLEDLLGRRPLTMHSTAISE